MLVARQVVADAKLAERDDVIRLAVVRGKSGLRLSHERTEQRERGTDGLSAFHAENNEVAFDSNLGNVVGENRHCRHTRRLPIGTLICTLFSDLLPQNKSMLVLSTFRAFVRGNLPDILWPIYAMGGIGVAILLYTLGHFVMVPTP